MSTNESFKNSLDLFDNPMTRAASQALKKEDIERYKNLGESMYKDINFETSTVSNSEKPSDEALLYIELSLNSGEHPSFLKEAEIDLLFSVYGEKWYERWGYTERDLKEIVTFHVTKEA